MGFKGLTLGLHLEEVDSCVISAWGFNGLDERLLQFTAILEFYALFEV